MYYYWKENKNGIKILLSSMLSNCEIVKDSKKNYNSRKYDSYLKIGSGFDTETSIIKIGDIQSAYVYHWQYSLNNIEVLGRNLNEFEDFFSSLIDIIPDGQKIITLVANLGYDYYFVKHRLVKYGIKRHFEKSVRNPLVIEVGEKIIFREVIGLFGKSLAHIAKNYCKTQKAIGDLEYSLTRLSKTPMSNIEIGYCVDDVKILSELGSYIFDNYFGKNKSLPLTSTNELRCKVKEEMGRNQIQIKNEMQSWMPDEKEYYLFRQYLFKGGLCGTNSLLMNKHLKNVGHADFNSHYPACMNHFLFPMGKPVKTNPKKFMTEKKPYIAVIAFSNLQSKTTHSIISIHKAVGVKPKDLEDYGNFVIDNGRIWRAKKVTFVLNEIEFKSICKAYTFDIEKTEIELCWEFEKYSRLPYYILNVLNREYTKKTVLKRQKKDNTLDYEFAKSIVNAMFGMLCTALYTDEFEIDENSGEIYPKLNEDGTRFKKSYENALKSIFLSPFWGMWVTSYARSLLIDFIVKFPNCIIQYDTDSIFYRTDLKESERLVKYIEKYNKDCVSLNETIFDNNDIFSDLGCFDVDKHIMTDFKGLGSKRYMYRQFNSKEDRFEIRTTVSGCKKGTIVLQFEKNTGKNADENIDEIFDFFKDGLTIDKEISKKFSSKYIPDYDGKMTKKILAFDYMNNPEIIELEPAVLLRPVEFKMGISETHSRFYMTIQKAYENAPAKYSKMFESIVDTFELIKSDDD